MIRTYLSNNFVRMFWIILTLSFFFREWWLYLILFLFSILVFWVFRKYPHKKILDLKENRTSFKSDLNNYFLSPIYGTVVSIHRMDNISKVVIQLVLSMKEEYGIYLPIDGEITNIIRNKSWKRWRYRVNFKNILKKGTLLNFKTANNIDWDLQIIPCWFGFYPKLYVLAGDKGRQSANIGFLPFGGTVLLYVPINSRIETKVGDFVFAYQTLLAQMEK